MDSSFKAVAVFYGQNCFNFGLTPFSFHSTEKLAKVVTFPLKPDIKKKKINQAFFPNQISNKMPLIYKR